MSWTDKVLATPVIGFSIVPDFHLAANYKNLISPLLNQLRQDGIVFTVKDQVNWGFEIICNTGFEYRFDAGNIIVEFKYPVEQKREPGQLPSVTIQELTQFSELLDQCVNKAKNVVDIIIENYSIQVIRIGVMARMALDFEHLPPGIQNTYNYLSSPWKNGLVKCETVLLSNIDLSDEKTDRCHHHIKVDTSEKNPQMEFILDWQRVFATYVTFKTMKQVNNYIDSSVVQALEYYNYFGQEGPPNE